MLLATADCSVAVALALRIHVLQGRSGSTCPRMFDERVACLCDDGESCAVADVQTIFGTLSMLICAFDVQCEPDILVHTLAIVERLVGKLPDCLCCYTWRPIVLTAFTLSAKKYFDDALVGIVPRLNAYGFTRIGGSDLFRYEAAFLDCLDWKLEVSRPAYTNYIFALGDLVVRHVVTLRKQYPELVSLARQLADPDDAHSAFSTTLQPVGGDANRSGLVSRTPPSVPTWKARGSSSRDHFRLPTLYRRALSSMGSGDADDDRPSL